MFYHLSGRKLTRNKSLSQPMRGLTESRAVIDFRDAGNLENPGQKHLPKYDLCVLFGLCTRERVQARAPATESSARRRREREKSGNGMRAAEETRAKREAAVNTPHRQYAAQRAPQNVVAAPSQLHRPPRDETTHVCHSANPDFATLKSARNQSAENLAVIFLHPGEFFVIYWMNFSCCHR